MLLGRRGARLLPLACLTPLGPWAPGRRRSYPKRSPARVALVAMATGGSERWPPSPPSPDSKQRTNRLIHEKSPYLLQHAHNPVDWYPWGQEAFDKARKENKPIFLSVGYSTCHWCHVMECESFENEEIGKILNNNFVCIKVDREERPDIDKVYMAFVQAISGGGGWPMSVWLTPELKPFVGGTYFPPEDTLHRPGFKTVLQNLSEQWKENQKALTERSDKILSVLQKATLVNAKAGEMPPDWQEVTERCFQQLAHSYEEEYGGFSTSPKFPSAVNFRFLFHFWALKKTSAKGVRALEMALHTLKMMALGGIRDHVGQGFHRYSTDGEWHVPHFEKMLYDQAQLALAFTDAYQISGDSFFKDVARDILQYVSRDLSDPTGGFYSAEDADSYPTAESNKKMEGAFCVWTEDAIRRLLPETVPGATQGTTMADIFTHHYGVKEGGNVTGEQDPHGELKNQNVLIIRYSLDLTAAKFDLEMGKLEDVLGKCRSKLFEVSRHRPRPHLDSKMLASWNGLMISGFARAGAVLQDKSYVQRAERAATFLRTHLFDSSSKRLLHSCYRGDERTVEQISSPIPGFLDDYAFVIRSLIDLYEASFDQQWLEWAVQLQEAQDHLFWDCEGFAYFTNDTSDPSVLIRLKEDQDGSEPSANSVSASNLLRLSTIAGRPEWADKSRQLLAAFAKRLKTIPIALPEMVTALMAQHHTLKEVVIRGELEADDTQELIRCVNSHYSPNKILLLADGNHQSFLYKTLPFLSALQMKGDKATAYLCQDHTCSLPVTSAEELQSLIIKSDK
uniref:Spermatosis associated 20 n=1 Tax=Callorhinchus milii TaxID=7868 RepID=A0A4W3GMN6_CALMI|eukprot:gi/632943542/ref/XP_007887005.1/ PREDICTED: spermatogenesis-associated protein 20 isoform X1 [Callorhinchus milii]